MEAVFVSQLEMEAVFVPLLVCPAADKRKDTFGKYRPDIHFAHKPRASHHQ
jgi:hypothetical protein